MPFKHEVISNKALNGKFNLIRFKSKSNAFFFKIGQFTVVKINSSVSRCYSFASTPKELPFWDIFVDITPGGPGTTYLKSLKPGGVIETLGASGQFGMEKNIKNYIFGATGCGIAPFLPMVEDLSKKRGIMIYVYWGLRDKGDIALANLLKSYSKVNKSFHFEIVLSKPDDKWKGKTGHVTSEILKTAKELPNKGAGIYLSGSKEFITDAYKLLVKRKFPSNKIYHEACY